jgi:ArsR family transcriptional regulator
LGRGLEYSEILTLRSYPPSVDFASRIHPEAPAQAGWALLNIAIFGYANASNFRKITGFYGAERVGRSGAGHAGVGNLPMNILIARDEDIERASRSMKAMSHPLRLKILCTLGDREFSVQDIVEQVGTSQSNISQHLAILRDKGILVCRKDANRVYYRVEDARTLRLIEIMRDVFCTRNA